MRAFIISCVLVTATSICFFVAALALPVHPPTAHRHAAVAATVTYNPCAPGRPPVNPDWGACRDGQFTAS